MTLEELIIEARPAWYQSHAYYTQRFGEFLPRYLELNLHRCTSHINHKANNAHHRLATHRS